MSDTSTPLIPPTWPLLVFYVTSIVTLPLYLLVFICLLRLRYTSKTYNSTFYTLLLQHSIADLFAMIFYFVIITARAIPFVREFYYNYQEYYIAAAAYNHIYYTLYIRCTGIILLSFQRYMVITHHNSVITNVSTNFRSPHNRLKKLQKIQSASKLQIIIVYWTLPTLISLVVLKDTNFHYDSLEVMAVIAEQTVIQRNTLMALIVVSSTCILCSLAYGALFLFVRKNSIRLSKSLRREVHLAAQVFILLLSFFIILVYYSFQNYFSQTHNTGPIFYMRGIYPMANGFLSYINPFCIIFLNKDFTRQIIRCVSRQEFKVSDVKISGIASNSTKQQRKTMNKITI